MSDTTHLSWTNERRQLSQLKPWPRNPRQIKADQAKRLRESFDEFDQVETLAIGPDGDIYNGHQRLNVLMQEYGGDYAVDVRVASRPLTEKEREKLTVYLHKGAAGEWDFDVLANEFELNELVEWGFKPYELGGIADDTDIEEAWKGMPEFEQEDLMGYQSIHVHFKNQEDVNTFAELIGQKIGEKTRAIWYPKADRIDMKSELYKSES